MNNRIILIIVALTFSLVVSSCSKAENKKSTISPNSEISTQSDEISLGDVLCYESTNVKIYAKKLSIESKTFYNYMSETLYSTEDCLCITFEVENQTDKEIEPCFKSQYINNYDVTNSYLALSDFSNNDNLSKDYIAPYKSKIGQNCICEADLVKNGLSLDDIFEKIQNYSAQIVIWVQTEQGRHEKIESGTIEFNIN